MLYIQQPTSEQCMMNNGTTRPSNISKILKIIAISTFKRVHIYSKNVYANKSIVTISPEQSGFDFHRGFVYDLWKLLIHSSVRTDPCAYMHNTNQ